MRQENPQQTLGVIGGGAAGFFAAINAARLHPNLKTVIFEKSREPLSKVRISGGGRCNVTHHCFDPEVMAKAYPRGARELRWAFEQFQPKDTVSWFKERNIELKTEEDGRMFPVTDDSSTIINCLKREANRYGVNLLTKTRVTRIQPHPDETFTLHTSAAGKHTIDYVLVAPGGSNRASQYEWLQDIGHSIVQPVPSLFTFNFRDKVFKDLAGISVSEASVSIEDASFEYEGPLLITHWGLSGPAVLKTSSWAARYLHDEEYRFTIAVNWVHPLNEQQVRQKIDLLRRDNARKQVTKQDLLPIPSRLWQRLLELAGIPGTTRWAECSNQHRHDLVTQLCRGKYSIQGKTTYKEEFVTSGGIPLKEVNMGTMKSKQHPNLFFAGEVLNIDGITGGYNFQSAWTTGWIAAQAIANSTS